MKILKNSIYIIILVIATIFIIHPLFKLSSVYIGNDSCFHLYRIKEIEEAIKAFRFPMYIGSVGNADSIDPIFYPNLFLYIPSFIDLFIKNINISYNVFRILVFVGYIIVSYYSAYIISKDSFVSTLFSISYSSSHYILLNVYMRDALGEYIGLLFMPLLLATLYNIYFDKGDKWFLLVISYTCILQSHIITTFYVSLIAFFICIILITKTFDIKIFMTLLKSAVLIFMINLWFIVPFLSSYISKKVHVTNLDSYMSYISEYINLFGNFKLDFYSLDANNYGLLFIFYIVVILVLISHFKIDSENKFYRMGLYSFLMFIPIFLLTFKNPVTDMIQKNDLLLSIYSKQQFSIREIGRSMPFLMFSFAFLVEAILIKIEDDYNESNENLYIFWNKIKEIVRISILVLVLILSILSEKEYIENGDMAIPISIRNPMSTNIIGYNVIISDINGNTRDFYSEYNIEDKDFEKYLYFAEKTYAVDYLDGVKISSDDIQINSFEKRNIDFDIDYTIKNFDGNKNYFIDLPFSNYEYFVARDNSNTIIPIYYGDEKNVSGQNKYNIRIKLNKEADVLKVRYEEPVLWTLSNLISFWTVILLLLHSFVKFVNDKKILIISKNIFKKVYVASNNVLNSLRNFYSMILQSVKYKKNN